jgi:hypothetical protein
LIILLRHPPLAAHGELPLGGIGRGLCHHAVVFSGIFGPAQRFINFRQSQPGAVPQLGDATRILFNDGEVLFRILQALHSVVTILEELARPLGQLEVAQ